GARAKTPGQRDIGCDPFAWTGRDRSPGPGATRAPGPGATRARRPGATLSADSVLALNADRVAAPQTRPPAARRRPRRRRRWATRVRRVGASYGARAPPIPRALPPAFLLRRLQRRVDRLVDALEPDELEALACVGRDLLEVAPVARRQHHTLDAGGGGGDDLLLDAAHRQHEAAQADLARHRGVAAHGAAGEQRDECGEHRHARARSVLRRRPGRHVDVDVELAEPFRVDLEVARTVLDDRQRRLRALAHHVAELP